MKILFTNDPPVISYGIVPGLKQIGEEAEIIPLWRYHWDEQAGALNKKIESWKPDYIFTEGDPPNFNRQSLLKLATDKGIPVIYWAIQDPLWFKEVSYYCASHADYAFTTTEELLETYRQFNPRSELLLFGCNPEFHRRVPPVSEYQYDIVFVGSNYPDRSEATQLMIEPLIREGLNFRIWGHWWRNKKLPYYLANEQYYGGLLPYDLLPQVYSSAKIVLGLHLDGSSLTQTSIRTYEVLGCGAFYLTQYTKAHETLFQKGVHLDWVTNEAELLELIHFYLNHDSEREKIALAGQKFVYSHHTVAHRARELITALKK